MTAAATPATAARQRFSDVLISEWTKVKSIRGTYIQIILSLALGLGITALFCMAIGSTWDDLSPEDQESLQAAEIGAIGVFFSLIVLVVFGVQTASSEYSSGMIRLTMTATPSRSPVLLAKAIVVIAGTLVIGLIVAVGSFFIAQVVLSFYEGIDTASITEEAALRSVLGSWLTLPVFPLLGAALAVVMRCTALTITGILGLIFVPSIFGPLLPESMQEIGRYFPNYAIDSISTMASATDDEPTRLDVLAAAGVLLGWLACFYFAAYISLQRRDV